MRVREFIKTANTVGCYFILIAVIACTSRIVTPNMQSSEEAAVPRGPDQLRVQRVGNTPLARTDLNIQFISQQEGWLSSKEKLWRTVNGGQDWQLIYLSERLGLEIKSFGFFNSQVGWMLRHGGLYKTKNGGNTWVEQHATPLNYPKGVVYSAAFMGNGEIGWVIGGLYFPVSKQDLLKGGFPNNTISPEFNSALYGAIFRTANGGVSWQQQFISPHPGRFFDLAFLDTERGLVIGDAGIYYTENGGNQWVEASFPQNCTSLADRNFYEQTPAYINLVQPGLGWLSFNNGLVVKSMDSAQTWCDLLRPEQVWVKGDQNAYFKKIHFLDSMHGWGLKANGSLYETRNGGASWEEVEKKIKFDDMYFLDTRNGWAVSEVGIFRILL